MLSPSERTFLARGVSVGIRADGRAQDDCRSWHQESMAGQSALGGASIIHGHVPAHTHAIATVKGHVGRARTGGGTLAIVVRMAQSAASGQTASIDATLTERVARLFLPRTRGWGTEAVVPEWILTERKDEAVPLAYHLVVDVLVLTGAGGSVTSTATLAARTALAHAVLPTLDVFVTAEEQSCKKQFDFTLADDTLDETHPLAPDPWMRRVVPRLPVVVTVLKVGDALLVDPTGQEEQCSTACVHVAVLPPPSCALYAFELGHGGCVQPDTLARMLQLAQLSARQLFTKVQAVQGQPRTHRALALLNDGTTSGGHRTFFPGVLSAQQWKKGECGT